MSTPLWHRVWPLEAHSNLSSKHNTCNILVSGLQDLWLLHYDLDNFLSYVSNLISTCEMIRNQIRFFLSMNLFCSIRGLWQTYVWLIYHSNLSSWQTLVLHMLSCAPSSVYRGILFWLKCLWSFSCKIVELCRGVCAYVFKSSCAHTLPSSTWTNHS